MGLFTMSVGQFEDMYGCFEELSSPFSEMTKVRELAELCLSDKQFPVRHTAN